MELYRCIPKIWNNITGWASNSKVTMFLGEVKSDDKNYVHIDFLGHSGARFLLISIICININVITLSDL